MSNMFQNMTTTADEDGEVEVKKTGKRGKSYGKRSKSKKQRDFDNNKQQVKASDDEEQKLQKLSLPDNDPKQKKLLSSTTLSTKKSRSQNHQIATGQNIPLTQVNPNTKTSQRQVKLNYFINHNRKKGELSTSNNNNNSATNSSLHKQQINTLTSKYAISQFQHRQSSLEKQLKEKQAILERIKLDREVYIERYNKLKIQADDYRMKCRQTMQKQLREFSRLKRQQKAQVNPKYGYYKQTGWTVFVEGETVLNAKKKLQQLQERIQELQNNKKTCSNEQKHLITAQIDHLNKESTQRKEDMKKLELIVNQYKEKLRLADKEQSCTMSRYNWDVIQNRYLPLELLGSGGFGQVYKAYDLENNIHVAIKVNCFEPTKNPQFREEFLRHVQRQVATLKELNHPNIVKLIDEILIDNKISFVLEYCTGPELSKYLIKNEYLVEHQARAIIKQVSYALRYMFNQRHRVIHYDLKPANIMFHHGCVKILDFGLCKKMETEDTKIDLTSQGVGTYWYLPPQTFMDGAEVSPKVDVWSMGVIFYELLYGKRPFGHGIGQNKIYQDGIILKALKVDFPTDKKYKVSEAAKDFIRECLKYNHEERLDPEQVYNHEYLNH